MGGRLAAVFAVAVGAALSGCGPTQTQEPVDAPAPVSATSQKQTGELRVAVGGGALADGAMATIVIRDVFDHTQNFLVSCQQKDHLLEGDAFCDELIVLPVGVYEVIVQSTDPACRAEFDWYKVIVEPNQTVELEIVLVCGTANGGLDVIVRQSARPLIGDIDFLFLDGTRANKFICREDTPLQGDVEAVVTVTDSDTPCEALTPTWFWRESGTQAWTEVVNVPSGPVWSFGPGTQTGPGVVPATCEFKVLIDADAALPHYDLKLEVTDGNLTGSFSFPIHLIDCEPAACTPALPSGGLYAEFDVVGERFFAQITHPTGIGQALALWQGTSTANIPVGDLVCTPAAFNCPWGWHFDPASITFADFTIEVCDGTPSYVDDNCASFGPVYCPWSATLVRLRDCRTDPACPDVPH